MNPIRRKLFPALAGMFGFGVVAKASPKAPAEDEFPASERFKLLYQRLHRAEDDAERRNVSLAGCSAAAGGATSKENECAEDQWAWHPAYRDVLQLRRKFDTAVRLISHRIQADSVIVLYPCGCWAYGGGHEIPSYCSGHGSPTRPNECTLIVAPERKRPTIAELEEILSQDPAPPITILPSGEVIAGREQFA